MAALFSPHSNVVARRVVLLAVLAVVGVPLFLMWWVRTPYVTGQGHTVAQPISLFSHQIHVTGLQIDCRYCHYTVERTATAGMPSSETCIPCHSQVWRTGPFFAPIRASLTSKTPIPWQRINRLPDYVFFNHAIHVNKGVGCETCHGRVDQMAQVRQAVPLTMSWCYCRGPAGWAPDPGRSDESIGSPRCCRADRGNDGLAKADGDLSR